MYGGVNRRRGVLRLANHGLREVGFVECFGLFEPGGVVPACRLPFDALDRRLSLCGFFFPSAPESGDMSLRSASLFHVF